METSLTISQVYNMIEILDTHDAIKKQAYEKAQQEQKRKGN